ncbi:MAG: 8-amino-7-oxononanoate synthase [Bdellovibrio sp. CG12_big_fil_rev_8_21_14_0_65_39_13]|nr:MAG: 8-amino-7-oxononanoate synthase [Bdellovibrio sp. CG22_combo_CG10-13_8_21_14_all_39_27]PIQ62249.1 MAG: 8-amino-7-oxononanoate synthase [Bdellovibrio sp. CG12_big_fil_rev_8_21_14_0_65_39_13]PIR34217.1 MAG: 8-amino-7-oxononanoate synthase [Bdellovibrio sp. CG11_big_fil_rev_8_21_14_0_20_39_38]PJB54315.1 MAG: 8-amino-7-oxononanoate synthase [Bdellovibrio sp. CG_4_9_14_3_um_filter_39_7]
MQIESLRGYKMIQKAKLLKEHNLYPFFRKIEQSEGTDVIVDGQPMIMIGSNNYLGLTHHPYVKEAAIKAIEVFGTGCTGSRFLNGNLTIHEELEDKLASYLGHEKAMIFATGMQTNLGALSAVCGPKDLMIFDSENHASIIDSSRLALGTTLKYKHNDMESLEEVLSENVSRFQNTMVVADGVFSMTGDILNLPDVVRLAKKYGASIYVDDAHGIGVMGDRGRGTMNHFGLTKDVDLNMGTFSKSFASIGGVLSGNADVIDYVKHTARSFMFSAAMAPSSVATVSACIDVILSDETIHQRLWSNVDFMVKGFKEIGFYTYNSKTPIIPVFIGDDMKAMQVTNYLKECGIFCTPVISPAVPKGEALIRTSYMATHSKEQLSKVLEVFKDAKEKFEIPSTLH